jgi:CHAD domain-containing protein
VDAAGQVITLAVPEKLLRKVSRHPWFATAGRPRRSRAHTVWFDTERFDLRQLGIRLSVIEAGGKSIQRVEADDGSEQLTGYRGSFNFWGIEPTKRRLQLDRALRRGLSPAFEAHSLVRVWDLSAPDCGPVQAKLLQGSLGRDGKEQPFSELQLFPREPGGVGHYRVAQQLIAEFGLRREALPVEERGFDLALARDRLAVTAGPSPLLPGQSCVEALRAIAGDCVAQFLANEAGALAARDSEYVHQMRVAMRRLRSGLRAFATLLPADFDARFTPELRAIAGALGAARDWDVTLEELILPVAQAHPEDERLKRLAQESAMLRDAARARCVATLGEGGHHRVLADLLAFLHCEWQGQADEPTPNLESFAAARLDWLHRKMEKATKGATADDVPTLHRLRIAIKRLRYSIEFFEPLFAEAEVRRYLFRMKDLQTDLGRLNDLANAYPRLAQCAADHPGMAEGVAFAHGWYAHQLAGLLRRIPQEIAPLGKLRRFWQKRA